jgi:hypothetical protein
VEELGRGSPGPAQQELLSWEQMGHFPSVRAMRLPSLHWQQIHMSSGTVLGGMVVVGGCEIRGRTCMGDGKGLNVEVLRAMFVIRSREL